MTPRPILLAALTALAAVPLGAQDAPARRRIAVLDFDYATVHQYVYDIFGSDQDIGKGIADLLVTDLVRQGTYSVIERKRLDEVMAEQNFQQSGRADASTAAQLGRVLGVDAIIIGSITQFGRDDKQLGVQTSGVSVGGVRVGGVGRSTAKAVVQIDARIVSIQTAEILGVATGKGESRRSGTSLAGGVGGANAAVDMSGSNFGGTIIGEAVNAAVDSLVNQLVAAAARITETRAAVKGLLADVAGNEVIVNIGTNAGIRVGAEYDVVRPGREVRDPATGRVLRRMTTPVGKVKITSADQESAVGTLTGGPAQVGDCVGSCPDAPAGGGGGAAMAPAPQSSTRPAAAAAAPAAAGAFVAPATYAAPIAGPFTWTAYGFKGTEHFKYDVTQVSGGETLRGAYTIDARPADAGRFRLTVEGSLGEDRYASSVVMGPNEMISPMTLMGLGPAAMWLLGGVWMPFFMGHQWEVGSYWSVSQGGETSSFKVESQCQHAGVSGLRGVLRQNETPTLEMCVSPRVALPVAVKSSDGGDATTLTLVEFRP